MATDTLKRISEDICKDYLGFSPTGFFEAVLGKPVTQEMFTSGLSATEERMLYRPTSLLINIRIFFKMAIKKRLQI